MKQFGGIMSILIDRWKKGPPPGEVPNVCRFRLLIAICFGLIIFGFIVDSPSNIFRGLWLILTNESKLLTDYMQVGGLGAAFINSGLTTLLSVLLLYTSRVHISGPVMAGVLTIAGFAFFGKNLYNAIPITLGVYLYSYITKVDFKTVILAALFGSALSPAVSQITFGFDLPYYQAIPAAWLTGIVMGVMVPILSSRFVSFHNGFNLYNTGFAAGVIGMFAVGVLRMFGMEVRPIRMLSQNNNLTLGIVLLVLFAFLFFFGYWYNGKTLKNYKELVKSSGRMVSDFIGVYGYGVTLINMSIVGSITTIYILLLGTQINGPILGAIFTVAGFGAFGKHPRNILPVMLGVYLASLVNVLDPSSTESVMSALFGTALAPIAGHYGVIAGVLAGFFHMSMVLNVGYLHGGINLYNNGFSGGFVAAVLVPLLDVWKQVKDRRMNERTHQGETDR